MSDIIETNKSEIKENLRSVDTFKKELDNVQKDAEVGNEVAKTQDVLENLQEANLIKILDKYLKKDGNEINYRDDYATRTAAGEKVITGETGIITTATQIAFKHLGINPGNIDGLYGPQTIAAVKLFKEKSGTTVENGIGPKTIAKIIEELKTPTIIISDTERSNLLANQVPVTENNTTENAETTDNKVEKAGEKVSKKEIIKELDKLKTREKQQKYLESYHLKPAKTPKEGYNRVNPQDLENVATCKISTPDTERAKLPKVTLEQAVANPAQYNLMNNVDPLDGYKLRNPNDPDDVSVIEISKNKIINSIEEISTITWKENTVKVLMMNNKQYGFFNNGRAGIFNKATKKYENMQDTQGLVNKLQEKITNKKTNLIKQLELKSLENGLYEKKDMKGLYKITNEGKLLYFGPDAGSKIFVGPKSDNRKSISEKEIPIDLKKNTIIKSLGLKEEEKNKYSKEGLTGFYAFGNDNKLYYSGTDGGNKVFGGYTNKEGEEVIILTNTKGQIINDINLRKDINTIPEEIDYISV